MQEKYNVTGMTFAACQARVTSAYDELPRLKSPFPTPSGVVSKRLR